MVAVPRSSMMSVPFWPTVTEPVAPSFTPEPLTLIVPLKTEMIVVKPALAPPAVRFTVVPLRTWKLKKAGKAPESARLMVPPPTKSTEFVATILPVRFRVAPLSAPTKKEEPAILVSVPP